MNARGVAVAPGPEGVAAERGGGVGSWAGEDRRSATHAMSAVRATASTREDHQRRAAVRGLGRGRPQRGVEGHAAAGQVELAGGVVVSRVRHAHAMAAQREPALHEPSGPGVGGSDELVVDVHGGAPGLRNHLDRASGHGRGGRDGPLGVGPGARARDLGRRRHRCRSRGSCGGRDRERLRWGWSGCGSRRWGWRRRGCRGRRGCRRWRRGGGHRRRPAGGDCRFQAGEERLALVGGLARAPRGRALERRARRVQLAERKAGFGQAQVREVARLDVGPVGEDVAARLGVQRNGALQRLGRERVVAARQRREPGPVGIVPVLGGCGRGDQEAESEGRSHEPGPPRIPA